MESSSSIAFMLDSIFLSISGIFVVWMIAGLTLFQAGLIRARNTNDILLKNIAAFAVCCIVYLLISYHMMYSTEGTAGLYFPDLQIISALDAFPQILATKPYDQMVGIFFQVMIAVIPLAIIAGATAERLRLWPFLFFSIFMVGFIYPVEGYWAWGDGFLKQLGFIDKAGAGVIHLAGAASALSALLLLGPRFGKYSKSGKSMPLAGANIPIASIGLLMIWIGTFGLYCGSMFYSPVSDFAQGLGWVLINTCIAGSTGLIVTMILSRIFYGTIDLTLTLNGAIVGLISISASPMTSTLGGTMLIATIAAILMVITLLLLDKLMLDDPIGAIAVHGIGGICALISVTFTQDYNLLSQMKNFQWHWTHQLVAQLIGIAVIFLWSFVASLLIWLLIRVVMGLRIKPEDEYKGLDVIGCGMTAYPEFTDSGWEK